MQAYRQSVAHLRPIRDNASFRDSRRSKGSKGSRGSRGSLRGLGEKELRALRKTVRLNSYRQSWHPDWMRSNNWIGSIALPEELAVELGDEDDDAFPDARKSRYLDPSSLEALQVGMQTWANSEMRDKWFPLLCNVARAVTQATPWGDTSIDKEARKGILIAVLRRFLEHSGNREVMAMQTREMLNTIKAEDPTLEIQLALVAFADDQAWEGADQYRLEGNWWDVEDLYRFRDDMDLLVQKRLHHINSDVSRTEARMTDAIEQWTEVHRTALCFGGGVHEVVPFAERTTTNKSGRLDAEGRSQRARLQRAGAGDGHGGGGGDDEDEEMIDPSDPYGSHSSEVLPLKNRNNENKTAATAPYRSRYADNKVHLKIHEIFVHDVNPSTGRRLALPGMLVVHGEYVHDGETADCQELEGRMRPCGEERVTWTGDEASFIIPKRFPDGEPEGFANIDRCEVVITMEERRTYCGFGGGRHVAQIVIPIRCLYDGIGELHSSSRAALVEERREADDDREVGIHYCQRSFVDPDSGIAIRATLTMDCCVEIHNRTPPRVDVIKEMARLSKRVEERRDHVWAVDHHQQFMDLADLLGELNDAENYALQLYADRFFIHPELLQVVCLVAFATKGNFNDYETREGMVEACQALALIKKTLKTRQCTKLCEDGLSLAQRQCLDRVLAIEDVASDPANGPSIMDACLRILDMMEVSERVVTLLVEERAIEYGDYVARKLRKLLAYIPANSAGDARMSALIELEQLEDNSTLTVKARAFYEIIDSPLFVLTNIVQFAVDSKDKRIQNLAYLRANVILERLFDPLTRAMTSIFGEFARTSQSDPLGGAFGVITKLYERIMEFVSVIDDVEPLEANCLRMVEPFNNFLPAWFSMCLLKVPLWIRVTVEDDDLEAIAPGRIFCNSMPSHAKNILESLFAVFDKVIDWVDPDTTFMYVTNFAKLILNIVECFTEALTAKALDSDVPAEWMVALCSMTKFETTIQLFWQVKIFNGICQTFGEEDGLLVYQCQSIKASCLENISNRKDELTDFIGASMRGAALAFLEEATERADDPFGTKDQINAVFGEVVTDCVRKEMALIADNTDKVTAPLVLIRAAKGLHASFADFAVLQSGTIHPTDFKERMLEALAAIEASLADFSGFDMIPPEVLFDLSHKSRGVLNVVSQQTPDIIESLDGMRASDLAPAERDRLIAVLKQRVNDKVAIRYLKNHGIVTGK